MGISLANILIILFIVLILFGAGKLPKVMGDLGKGIKSFKDGLKEGETSENKKLPKDKDKNEK
jgi:sec-independent protein translocase protein TatA